MFLKLSHQNLDIFKKSKTFVLECYKLSKQFPSDEKFQMISQIRRAALSVHLNIAEGCSKKSETERKRFFEISRGSLIEIDAAFDVANDLAYLKSVSIETAGSLLIECFKMLPAIIESKVKQKTATH
jgi:four helix bundle protein